MSALAVVGISGLALATALSTVVVAFVIARFRGRYDTIDTAWGTGLAAIAVLCFGVASSGVAGLHGAGSIALVATVLTVLWGLRLAVHLHLRNRHTPEDPRYQAILDRSGRRPAARMFVRVYLTQAAVMWFVSVPLQFVQLGSTPEWGVLAWSGVAVWGLGFAFETVGDAQLQRFRADPANQARVLTTGLWRYTRHPNYFGDACVWWGLYLLACHHLPGVLTIVSPVLMTWLLARGTGKPMLERHLIDRRPDYADYVRRTSGFLPLPPKRR